MTMRDAIGRSEYLAQAISVQQLEERLAALGRGAKIVGITLDTVPKLLAAGKRAYPNIRKRTRYNALVQFDYENGVNNRRKKEGSSEDFQSGGNWHTPERDEQGCLTPFTRSNRTNERYLYCRVLKSESEYYDSVTGDTIDKSDLSGYWPASSSRQGTRDEVQVRAIKLSNVTEFTYGGETLPVVSLAA